MFSWMMLKKNQDTEKVTNHDVESRWSNFWKKNLSYWGLDAFKEFIHFGPYLTGHNNTATPLNAENKVFMKRFPRSSREVNGESCMILLEDWKEHRQMLAKSPWTAGIPLSSREKKLNVFVASPKRSEWITGASSIRCSLVVHGKWTHHRSLSQVIDLEWFRFQFLWNQYFGSGEKLTRRPDWALHNMAAIFDGLKTKSIQFC